MIFVQRCFFWLFVYLFIWLMCGVYKAYTQRMAQTRKLLCSNWKIRSSLDDGKQKNDDTLFTVNSWCVYMCFLLRLLFFSWTFCFICVSLDLNERFAAIDNGQELINIITVILHAHKRPFIEMNKQSKTTATTIEENYCLPKAYDSRETKTSNISVLWVLWVFSEPVWAATVALEK